MCSFEQEELVAPQDIAAAVLPPGSPVMPGERGPAAGRHIEARG